MTIDASSNIGEQLLSDNCDCECHHIRSFLLLVRFVLLPVWTSLMISRVDNKYTLDDIYLQVLKSTVVQCMVLSGLLAW